MYDLIIRNCHILTPSSEVRRNCDLIIDAGKIIEMLPAGQAEYGSFGPTGTGKAHSGIQSVMVIADHEL
jgi:hypothetical protein